MADGLQQGSQVAVGVGLLERGVQVGVVALKCFEVGVGGQDSSDGGGGAGGLGQRGGLVGLWCGRRHLPAGRSRLNLALGANSERGIGVRPGRLFVPRVQPAPTRTSWAPISNSRPVGVPTESPQVRVSGGGPHKKPTDETALCGTRRHGC